MGSQVPSPVSLVTMLNPWVLLTASSFVHLSLCHPFQKRAFSNGPVITENFPDPGLISVGDTYYAFATNNGQQNVPVASSGDFVTWTVTGQDALPNIPSWSSGAVWAPDPVQLVRTPRAQQLHSDFSWVAADEAQADGSFVLYFTAASTQDTSKHCVGAATSSSVTGPYTALDTPLACPLE